MNNTVINDLRKTCDKELFDADLLLREDNDTFLLFILVSASDPPDQNDRNVGQNKNSYRNPKKALLKTIWRFWFQKNAVLDDFRMRSMKSFQVIEVLVVDFD